MKCLGLPGVPEAGAEFRIYENERLARTLAQELFEKQKQQHLTAPKKISLENLFSQIEGEKKIDLTPETVIVTYAPGSKDELKPGAKIYIPAATKQEDGSLTAARINVGRGIAPPM